MSLFSKISGDEGLTNIDNRIDSLFTKIPSKNEFVSAEDLTGEAVDSIISNSDSNEVSQLLENVSIPHERIQRYGVYTELSRAVPMIKRILRVYLTNLLQKNPVDGRCIIFKDEMKDDTDKQKVKTVKEYSKEIIKQFNIVKKLKSRIVPLMLLYGDSYIEVINVKKRSEEFNLKDISMTSQLNESINLFNDVKNFNMRNKFESNNINKILNESKTSWLGKLL